MLNISHNRIEGQVDQKDYKAFGLIWEPRAARIFKHIVLALLVLALIILLLPWTQNIRAKGYVTTLQPGQRPQAIPSIIAGRIEKWYVREGDFVSKGDTILQVSEVKDDYFDPDLIPRTEQQLAAKGFSVSSYQEKLEALDAQYAALLQTRNLKLAQARNYIRQAELKVQSDSMDFQAAKIDYDIAAEQYRRMEEMYNKGIESLVKLEARKLKLQESQAKRISAENKWLGSQNELLNAKVELGSLENQYQEKLSKIESDKFSVFASIYDTQGGMAKMENQLTNYRMRQGYHFVTAPQDGYVTKAIKYGVGETVKEGDKLVSVMPADYQLAVEMYINPLNLPLMNAGQEVRLVFDGWPAIVFSGWPGTSYGTFGGRVVATDRFASDNGKFRVLVAPDPDEQPWPDALRIGSGSVGMVLLKNVPIWYELWRQLNGFPPDFYKPDNGNPEDLKQKAPIRAVK
ncbi:MAG: HlyD family efflux transporter periplasmic adaptor subunit [Lewinellaceae bacterium]|nr:HlyD family efflux transporter periplasmic adaptor subunit [Saprospiraceae bacterium]MCB9338915.1 HlyD family efflux transporter periplasmic adaptor subunit [Lewinellaceae bacterium]